MNYILVCLHWIWTIRPLKDQITSFIKKDTNVIIDKTLYNLNVSKTKLLVRVHCIITTNRQIRMGVLSDIFYV